MIGRSKPYTEIGIRRVPCAVSGCVSRAEYQWQCCANSNLWMPLCAEHDVDLNRLVLDWMGHPERDDLMAAYSAKVGDQADRRSIQSD
jgi:hypothetical protein